MDRSRVPTAWERRDHVITLGSERDAIDVAYRELGRGRGCEVRFFFAARPIKMRALESSRIVTNAAVTADARDAGWSSTIVSTQLIPFLQAKGWRIRANRKRRRGPGDGPLWSFKIAGGRSDYPYASYSGVNHESYVFELSRWRGEQRRKVEVDVSD